MGFLACAGDSGGPLLLVSGEPQFMIFQVGMRTITVHSLELWFRISQSVFSVKLGVNSELESPGRSIIN